MVDSVSAAKLAIYIILAQPALYCLFKHGKTGFIGWLYIQIFCVLRIATGGIGLHGASGSTGTIVLNSIGLSPLLLAASGILHEALVIFPWHNLQAVNNLLVEEEQTPDSTDDSTLLWKLNIMA